MTQAAMLPNDVAIALSVQEMLDAWEHDPPSGEGDVPPEKAQRLGMLVQLGVQMATGLKLAWRMCMQERTGWEIGPYVRRVHAIEFLARAVVDILTRTQQNVARTHAAHPGWPPPREMAEVQSNLAAAQEILAGSQESLAALNRFSDLASRWKRETRFCSSRTQMVEHPAYQEIIAMGPAAIPLIVGELKTEPRYWFPALNALTGEDPVPEQDRGIVHKMTDAWLHWGKAHGR